MIDHDRIKLLEKQVADLQRIVQSLPVREAVTSSREPMLFGVLEDDLHELYEVDMSVWRMKADGTWEDTGQDIKVWDGKFLDSAMMLEATGSWVGAVREPHSKLWVVVWSKKCAVPAE